MKAAIRLATAVIKFRNKLESGNGIVDGQTGQKQKTNGQNYTNFESILAMMVIYPPVKFEFNWTKRFQVSAWKRKC